MIPADEFTFELQDHVLGLLKACERASSQGLERMILVKMWKRAPKNWSHVLVMPGVRGRIVGSPEQGKYLVDVAVADVVKVLERIMRVP